MNGPWVSEPAGSGPFGHLGDALSGLLDGELGTAQQQAALDHVSACPVCAGELLGVRQARTWVRALPAVEAPLGFYEGLLGPPRLRPSFPGRPSAPAMTRAQLRRRAGLAAAAAAAAVTVLGVGSPRQSPVAPSGPSMAEANAGNTSVGADLLSKLAPMGVPVSFGR